jgi:hypothetical protein
MDGSSASAGANAFADWLEDRVAGVAGPSVDNSIELYFNSRAAQRRVLLVEKSDRLRPAGAGRQLKERVDDIVTRR